MECYQISKVVMMIIMYLDSHDSKNHDHLIIVTTNNHYISIFNDNCPTLPLSHSTLHMNLRVHVHDHHLWDTIFVTAIRGGRLVVAEAINVFPPFNGCYKS